MLITTHQEAHGWQGRSPKKRRILEDNARKGNEGARKGSCFFFFFNAQLKMVKSSNRRIEGDYPVFKHDKALF